MTTIYDPATLGFNPQISTIDRCQIALLRSITAQFGSGRMILKGGMAMRVSVGSMRLTKDLDFNRAPSLSLASLKGGINRLLGNAAMNAGIRQSRVDITKASTTTLRARLEGISTANAKPMFEVEVSGRSAIDPALVKRELVVPPSSYGLAPFVVECYSNDALAAQKTLAAMSDSRDVPRDIHDLFDLATLGADPSRILAGQAPAFLSSLRGKSLGKLEQIGFDRMREELAPYLPVAMREAIDDSRWTEMLIKASESIEAWVAHAIEIAGDDAARPPPRST